MLQRNSNKNGGIFLNRKITVFISVNYCLKTDTSQALTIGKKKDQKQKHTEKKTK